MQICFLKKVEIKEMTRTEIMNELNRLNIAYNKKAKKEELEKLFREATARENKEIENRAKETKKVKYSRDDRLANIASLIANDAYDANLTIKLMSNKSVSIKKDKKRLFRLDLLAKEYQLTSDRDTLVHADSRVESIYDKSKNKFYYRYRTKDKQDVIDVMRKCIDIYK